MTSPPEEERPNALIREKSPYLLQHAYNPVEWLPWGEEAIRRAREEGKPIFLSIGYSTCHWCHVMERESFSDPEIARIINKHFIPVKVDREERPDIDELYMRAVQAMTGQGGWPLTVFLTPELEPFFGGTYFPPERRLGLPGLKEVLLAVANEWRERREELSKSGSQILSLLSDSLRAELATDEPSTTPMELAYEQLVLSFDKDFGGFGGAPKFPMPGYLFLLLRYWWMSGERAALTLVEKTLTQMYLGGIYDHVGGGFHRYAVDRAWLIPHFEKMLYDNAELLRVYCEAYQASGKPLFRDVALDVAGWLLREMRGEEGLFYSAIDADSEGEEGKYYVWAEREIREIFGEREGEAVARFLGVTENGNFEKGKSVIHLAGRIEDVASSLGMDPAGALRYIREKLSEARSRRVRPLVDDKALVGWNGLAISALAYSGFALERGDLLEAAKTSADAVLRNLVVGGELRRYWRSGPSSIPAMLEDYAALGCALHDVWQYSGEARYLEWASWVAERMIENFWAEGGGFYPSTRSDVPVKIVDAYDGPLPSGNSLAVSLLSKLYLTTGRDGFRERALATVRRFWRAINMSPTSYPYMASSLGLLSQEHKQLVIIGPEGFSKEEALSRIPRFYEPYMVILIVERNKEPTILLDALRGKGVIDGRPTYYLCRAFTCKMPTSDVGALREMLAGGRRTP